MEEKIIVNRMPSPTFNWLNINYNTIPIPSDNKLEVCIVKKSRGFTIEKSDSFSINNIKTGMGEDYKKEIEKSKNILKIETKEGLDNISVKLALDISKGGKAGVEIKVNKGTKANVFLDIVGGDTNIGCIETRYIVEDNAILNLIQDNKTSGNAVFANDIGGVIKDNAAFHLVQLVLNGEKNYYGNFALFDGIRSNFTYDMAYIIKDDNILDINSVVDYKKEKCNADTKVYGIMRDRSKKSFRGTINFCHGCKGSKGSELEKVILMDKEVENKTVPVILCDEEDVEGSHGASLGRLDEEVLQYMKVRGLPEDIIYKMMSDAMIYEVMKKIPEVSFED